MPRYLSQPGDTTICGPTLVINALKWGGMKATRDRTMAKAKKETKWEYDGAWNTNILAAMRKMGKGVIRVRYKSSTPAIVRDHILNGGAACLSHNAHDRIQHVSLAIQGSSPWLPITIVNAQLSKYERVEHGVTMRSFMRLLRRKTTTAHLITKWED